MNHKDVQKIVRAVVITLVITFLGFTYRSGNSASLSLLENGILFGVVALLLLGFLLSVNRGDLKTAGKKTKQRSIVFFCVGLFIVSISFLLSGSFKFLSENQRNIGLAVGSFCMTISAALILVNIFSGSEPGTVGPSIDGSQE